MGITIQPYEHKTTYTITTMDISVIAMELFKSVTVNVRFMDERGACVEADNIRIEGADYLAWTNDDTYILRYVALRKGISLETPVEPTVEPPATETPVEPTAEPTVV